MADQHVITTRGTTLTEAVLKDSTIQAFKARLRGTLLRPGDDRYDETRKVYNAMIDKRPALIVRCAGKEGAYVGFSNDHDHGRAYGSQGSRCATIAGQSAWPTHHSWR